MTLVLNYQTDPRSLYNLVPKDLQKAVETLLPADFEATEETYFSDPANPRDLDPQVNRIRMEFWKEYDRATVQKRRMDLAAIAIGSGMQATLLKHMLSKRANMAWVIIQPGTYESFLDEALSYGLTRLRRDILGASLMTTIIDKAGDSHQVMDHKAADLLLKAVAFLDMRKNGGIVNKSLHVHKRADELKPYTQQPSMEELDKRIAELEEKGVVDKAIGIIDAASPRPINPPLVFEQGVGELVQSPSQTLHPFGRKKSEAEDV